MQFKNILALALASAAASANEMHDAALYAQRVAPGELARIGAFKSTHAANMTAAQAQFLDDALAAVAAPAAADVAGLEKTCAGVFGDLCAFILAGKSATTPSSSRVGRRADVGGDMLNRRAACECSDGSDWCSAGFQCGLNELECAVGSIGCGTFGLYPCNGLCVQI